MISRDIESALEQDMLIIIQTACFGWLKDPPGGVHASLNAVQNQSALLVMSTRLAGELSRHGNLVVRAFVDKHVRMHQQSI